MERDRSWISAFLTEHWGSPHIVTRGKVHQADFLPGYIAFMEGQQVGLITYCISGNECEIVSLNSICPDKGFGTALIEAVKFRAMDEGCRRLWLITTNDNTHALRYYQKRGFRLKALYRDSITQARLLKPLIPLTGNDSIPIVDEIECELLLA